MTCGLNIFSTQALESSVCEGRITYINALAIHNLIVQKLHLTKLAISLFPGRALYELLIAEGWDLIA